MDSISKAFILKVIDKINLEALDTEPLSFDLLATLTSPSKLQAIHIATVIDIMAASDIIIIASNFAVASAFSIGADYLKYLGLDLNY
mmetsp:Transcript_45474/g.33248  ORF Transcript_45474/g.33248 Transcript_45474/m.33248 type:complete len:87 (-) Transcript_45474:23-283(-)